jgi:hypothetical protein
MDFTSIMNNAQRAAATSPAVPATTAPKKSALDTAMGILNTPGGAALISAAGAGIGAYGANKAAAAGREQSAQQFAAELANRQFESDRTHQQNAAIGAANASPLGAEQTYAQRNAILGAILGNARNFSITPGDPAVAAAMGAGPQGGLRLPTAGLDPAMLERMFGDKATMESIANRQMRVGQIDPRGQALNLGSLYGDAGLQATQDVDAASNFELERQMAEQAKQREIIQRAIDEDIRGNKGKPPEGYEYDKKTGELKKKGSSIWKKIGKAAIIGGAGVATAMTGGAAAPLIGIAAGMGTGAIDGGLKGALMGGAMGGLTGGLVPGLGGAVGGGIKQGIGQAVKSTLTNPNTILRMGGNALGGTTGGVMDMAGQMGAGKYLVPRRK